MASGGKKEGTQILFGIKDEVMPASDAWEKKKKSGAYAPHQGRNHRSRNSRTQDNEGLANDARERHKEKPAQWMPANRW